MCKIVGMESILPDGFHFLHEIAGESETGGEMSGKGIEGGGFSNCCEEWERERALTINTIGTANSMGQLEILYHGILVHQVPSRCNFSPSYSAA